MGDSTARQIDKLTSQVIIIYYCLMIVAIGVVGIGLFLALRTNWIIWYVLALVVLHTAWIVIIVNSKFETEKYFIPHYYIFMIIYLFPAVLILGQIKVYSILLLYMLLPLIILFRYHTSKYTVYAAISSMLLIVSVIVISLKIQVMYIPLNVNEDIVFFIFVFIIIAAMIFLILFFYFYNEILKLPNDEKLLINKVEEKTQEENSAQLKELYGNVINYFEKKQPYRQPNYRLAMLADELNTNTKYLSEAINTYYGGSFESLLNKYRLEFVKKMLDERLAEKYTMEYIYTLAGYSSRATFYENFRKKFNMSPLDYQRMQKV
jgi:AraC-like DNA-binding protein